MQSSVTELDDSFTSPEPKREDLTERLKKEFGLKIDDDEEAVKEGDETPETAVSPPPPPPPPSAPASTAVRFTPTQYPSYPSNYPLPPYPPAKYPTPVAASTSYSRESISYPPPMVPPPSAPPPPVQLLANAPHPPPPSSLTLSSSRSNNVGITRRPSLPPVPSSTGKEYYSSHTASSRGYFPNSSGSGRRDRDHRDHRERDRDYRGDHHRSSSSSSARRNPFHGSRSYY